MRPSRGTVTVFDVVVVLPAEMEPSPPPLPTSSQYCVALVPVDQVKLTVPAVRVDPVAGAVSSARFSAAQLLQAV